MAQSTILAPGNTAATSADIVLISGQTAVVGIFKPASGAEEALVEFRILQATPGADNAVWALNNWSRAATLTGPGTFRVERPAYEGEPLGVFVEV